MTLDRFVDDLFVMHCGNEHPFKLRRGNGNAVIEHQAEIAAEQFRV